MHLHRADSDDTALVSVSDDGPGIDPADVEKIFLPFYRADRSRSRDGGQGGGAGLGLALARRIAEQHDGTLVLVPDTDRGATFELRLPRA